MVLLDEKDSLSTTWSFNTCFGCGHMSTHLRPVIAYYTGGGSFLIIQTSIHYSYSLLQQLTAIVKGTGEEKTRRRERVCSSPLTFKESKPGLHRHTHTLPLSLAPPLLLVVTCRCNSLRLLWLYRHLNLSCGYWLLWR